MKMDMLMTEKGNKKTQACILYAIKTTTRALPGVYPDRFFSSFFPV